MSCYEKLKTKISNKKERLFPEKGALQSFVKNNREF